MMQNDLIGTVLNNEGDHFLIAIQDDAQCHSCGLHGVCQDKQLSLDKTEVHLDLNRGERVALHYHKILGSSAWLYLMPLLAFFAGIFLVNILFPASDEAWLFAGGFIGLTMALTGLRAAASHFKTNEYKIHISKVE